MRISKTRQSRIAALLTIGVLGSASLALTGCNRNVDSGEKGPAEVAGKELDRAAIQAGRELKEAARETGKVIEKAGARLQEKAEEAQK